MIDKTPCPYCGEEEMLCVHYDDFVGPDDGDDNVYGHRAQVFCFICDVAGPYGFGPATKQDAYISAVECWNDFAVKCKSIELQE